jgi:hypothetical protein
MDKSKFALIMKAIAIITSAVTVLLLCIPFRQADWWLPCTISLGTTAYHFVMRLAVGYLLPALTNYHFDYHHPWFQPRKWEAVFYKRLRVRSWKGKLPTYAPSQFSLEGQSLHRVIQNMCGAELVHEIIMVLSFLPLLTVPLWGEFGVFLITSALAALFDSIFVMAQRHNRPRLVRIYEKKEAKASE